VFSGPFAFDIETTMIVGQEVPKYVLGAASDGNRGYFLLLGHVPDFLAAHWEEQIIFHNCAFDLAVLDKTLCLLGKSLDVYDLVDRHQVWDTMLLHRLHGLCTLGHTYQGKGQSTLEKCAQLYLNVVLPKDVKDQDGDDVRTSWGKWLGRPPGVIHTDYLEYLRADVLATVGCFQYLLPRIRDALGSAQDAFGYVDGAWLERQQARFGPQTHHLQVMAHVALTENGRAGFGLDQANRNELLSSAEGILQELRESLRLGGYLEGEKGCDKALQAIIRRTLQENPDLEVPTTDTGKYSTKEEHLDALAHASEFFARLKEFKALRSLIKNHLRKMNEPRVHAHYDVLKNTGRTSASNPSIQNLPKKKKKRKGRQDDFDVRRCFVPAPGKIFYVADYSSIELRTLAQSLMTQFGLDSHMARALNAGQDVHRLVAARMKATRLPDAAAVLADPARFAAVVASVTAEERGGAKPANFGLPAGMGVPALKAYARAQYDQPYTDADAQGWKDAWLASFPEMNRFLEDNLDAALQLARLLQLTPADYSAATGERSRTVYDQQLLPAGWLGGMAFKVLKDPAPQKRSGEEYSAGILDYYWGRLQQLAPQLKPDLRQALLSRQPGGKLLFAIKKLVNRAGVFTSSGRLRAKASYSAWRNTIFQGAAADGAKLALYRLWRAGFKVVAFIHDEVVIELDERDDLAGVKEQIDAILICSMQEFCPDMRIEVEGAFRRRWGKDRADEIPIPAPEVVTREAVVV
jgi:hypothetical protein